MVNRTASPSDVLGTWWMFELFSPQSLPKLTKAATRPDDQQVVVWQPDAPLPWESLPAPAPFRGKPRVWQHSLYLGIYELESTYQWLQHAFGDDREAYDERPGGSSACAAALVDQQGQLLGESVMLSSALWGVGQIYQRAKVDPRWMHGFEGAQTQFVTSVDALEGRRRDRAKTSEPVAQDSDSLASLVRLAHSASGVIGLDDLATGTIIIRSSAVMEDGTQDAELDFLNSFFLEDLAKVRDRLAAGDSGAAIQTYLTGEADLRRSQRIDVIAESSEIDAGVALSRLPKGRWPSNPQHPLALSQQFAVNKSLHELAPRTGIIGVNGPPGTGKTTMLRDLLAANVVERARVLASLSRPADAFSGHLHTWKAGNITCRVPELRQELTGFEMVVASANNAAVENVTTEIPALSAIHDTWQGTADYFAELATKVLTGDSKAEPLQAWGMIAAKLGNRHNRNRFRSTFWFDAKAANGTGITPLGMQSILERWANDLDPHPSWSDAQEAFARAEQRVDTLIRHRKRAEARLAKVPSLVARDQELAALLRRDEGKLRRGHSMARDCRQQVARATALHSPIAEAHQRKLASKPGFFETFFTFGRATKKWRREYEPLAEALGHAERGLETTKADLQQAVTAMEDHQRQLANHQHESVGVREELARVRAACRNDEESLGRAYPGAEWVDDRRELRAPWLDATLDRARSELFIAALQLHKDFLANAAPKMLGGLRAAMDVVSGRYPRTLDANAIRAAWQLFFLVVPMVSTTFASAGRMFGDLGRESLGWLFIDEAGQACPQYATGSIWRAKRAVVVGDPLQLEPVVTIPAKAQFDIASKCGVSETWIPPRSSVQRLADRVAVHGTMLDQGDERVWVSAPLRVHRRCDDPMFSLCNEIAYNGIMVNGVHRDLTKADPPDLFDPQGSAVVAKSYWADTRASRPGSHLQPAEIDRLKKALDYLRSCGLNYSDIIAVSPFREIANQLSSLASTYPGLLAGTIHTAQGREAPVVILVLGGDPDKPGAKAWAASKPNLVNVAASRAQRRLYVIGDRDQWAQHPYFRELAAALTPS